jgi:membrane associated rhomboid family serine protease
MFPINDTEPNRYSFFPFMTTLLIAASCIMFFVEIFIFDGDFWTFLMKFGVTPQLILNGEGAGAIAGITSLFLHADIPHLLGNMVALWVFGRRVEDACGSLRFLGFYVLAGSIAHILYVIVEQDSLMPSIGASGAIFGLMGAYLLLYPGGRIRTLVFITFVPLWPRIRAIWVVLYFLGIQIIPALQILLNDADYQVNHWAHLGGFFSAVFVMLFLRPEAFARYMSDVPV